METDDPETLRETGGGGIMPGGSDPASMWRLKFPSPIGSRKYPVTGSVSAVDSSVGGKVGVNLPGAKNMVGAFWQPLGVLIDTQVLDTLPVREYRAGLAEVVKYGVILDADFFAYREEVEQAVQEGVEFIFLVSPRELLKKNGRVDLCEFLYGGNCWPCVRRKGTAVKSRPPEGGLFCIANRCWRLSAHGLSI